MATAKALDKQSNSATSLRALGLLLALVPMMALCAGRNMTMHIPFDGSAEASAAGGDAKPVVAEGLEFGPGRFGQAVRLNASMKSRLAYVVKGNIDMKRGSMSFWLKRDSLAKSKPQAILALETGREDGWGRFAFGLAGDNRFFLSRDDVDGKKDNGTVGPWKEDVGTWEHWVISWGMRTRCLVIYRGGDGTREFRPYRNEDQCSRQMLGKIKKTPVFAKDVPEPSMFFLGSSDDPSLVQLEGWLDDVRIYDQEMNAEDARELFDLDREAVIPSAKHFGIADDETELCVKVDGRKGGIDGVRIDLASEDGEVVASSACDGATGEARLRVKLPMGKYEYRAVRDGKTISREPYTVLRKENPYELPATATPGEPRNLKFVKTVKPDLATLTPENFRALGKCTMQTLDGETYLEGGNGNKDRFAIRFSLPATAKLYLIDIVYPDDKYRMVDYLIQPTGTTKPVADPAKSGGGKYSFAQGISTGAEFPCTMKMQHHRCLYWMGPSEDLALIAMAWRPDAPAALSRFDIYEVTDGALPVTDIALPKENTDPMGRQFGQFWEDPNLTGTFGFGMDDPESYSEQIDRYAAIMRYCGQNILTYPGSWYRGIVDAANDARPNTHVNHFLEGYYAKFEREGLYVMPNIEFIHTFRPPSVDPTFEMISNGVFHSSQYPIHSDGTYAYKFGHGWPSVANFFHPETQREIEEMFRELVAEGVHYKSFKGISLQLYRDGACWWGDIKSGYNDYCIDAFERDTGIKVPVDRSDPLRGKAYYEWLVANHRDEWVRWRCEKFTEFYAKMAKILSDARSDLKIWFIPSPRADAILNLDENPDYFDESYASRSLKDAGFDGEMLAAAIPNAILGVTVHPQRNRKRWQWAKEPRLMERFIGIYGSEGWYRQIQKGEWPHVTLRDEFMETNIRKRRDGTIPRALTGDWLKEIDWRCSTINASGVNAMRYFAVPFRYGDVLGFTRGSFLVCDYGWESYEARFAQNFRALPAVKFDDLPCGELVKMRHKDYAGKSWFYVVNTDSKPCEVRIRFPEGTVALADGGAFSGETALSLEPYSIRSFSAPEGAIPELN